MLTFTKEQIKEISEQLNCGLRAFYDKLSGDLIFVPDTDKYIDIETDAWQDELEKLDKNFSEYQEIDAMKSRESFEMMADFAEKVPDRNLRNKLIEALHSHKPFRAFFSAAGVPILTSPHSNPHRPMHGVFTCIATSVNLQVLSLLWIIILLEVETMYGIVASMSI